jgi:hypothetical protein
MAQWSAGQGHPKTLCRAVYSQHDSAICGLARYDRRAYCRLLLIEPQTAHLLDSSMTGVAAALKNRLYIMNKTNLTSGQ